MASYLLAIYSRTADSISNTLCLIIPLFLSHPFLHLSLQLVKGHWKHLKEGMPCELSPIFHLSLAYKEIELSLLPLSSEMEKSDNCSEEERHSLVKRNVY